MRSLRHTYEMKTYLCSSASSLHSADSLGLFLYTPTSLLLNHALITDEQQITGNNTQKWINCTSGKNQGRPEIYNADQGNIVSTRGSSNTATSELNSYTKNGIYYCHRTIMSTRAYFSVYLKSSSKQVDVVNL